MSLADPVSKDNFHYNGHLYVEVANHNRHQRATPAELTDLLRPNMKKGATAGKGNDPAGHWYEAQLLHYGLPPSKDKARAKVRLLDALNSGKLSIPASIQKLETSLQKEFAQAERKAKAAHKARELEAGQQAIGSRGRKANDEEKKSAKKAKAEPVSTGSKKRKVESVESEPSKKRKAGPAASKKTGDKSTRASTTTDSSSQPRKKQTAKRGNSSFMSRAPPPSSPSPPPPRTKQTAKRSGAFRLSRPPPQRSPTPPSASKPRFSQQQTARRSAAGPPLVSRTPAIKTEPSGYGRPAAPKSLGLINGYYDINCPTVEEEWPSYTTDGLGLTVTLDGPQAWAAYEFGMFEGIMLIHANPTQASPEPLPLSWRGRDMSEHIISFSARNSGAISFLGNGQVEGYTTGMYGEEMRFSGVRQPGPASAVRSAADMRREWDGYNERAYEEENASRWH